MTKLRAILLMEDNFNATNKIVYGSRMIQTAQGHQLIPEEIFSKKNRMADDGTLCKTLFYNITRQARVPAAIASVDASNCYDQIAHAMASLIFQAFGVPLNAVETMLGAIENMKFFLRTGFWRLKNIHRKRNKHQDTRSHTRQRCISSRMGSYKHLHTRSTWKEGARR